MAEGVAGTMAERLIMLMGGVIKNSILLVDARQMRARPITMITVPMIAAMTPIALDNGADASFRQPMAFADFGELQTSTARDRSVVPVVFTLVDALERWLRKQFRLKKSMALSVMGRSEPSRPCFQCAIAKNDN